MKYVSIDIETTGLDAELDQILEFGAIIEDTNNLLPFEDVPKFHSVIKHDRYSGSAYAINMNQRIFKILADRADIVDNDDKLAYDTKYNICNEDELAREFYNYIYSTLNAGNMYGGRIPLIVAGKNFFGFDNNFLSKLPEWDKLFRVHRRVIDPATMFWKPFEDKVLPSLDECIVRAGIKHEVTHNAIEDAWDVIQVLRTKYSDTNL